MNNVCNQKQSMESNIVDMSKLTVDELLEEVQKRVQSSPDTKLKRKLATLLNAEHFLPNVAALRKKQRSTDRLFSYDW